MPWIEKIQRLGMLIWPTRDPKEATSSNKLLPLEPESGLVSWWYCHRREPEWAPLAPEWAPEWETSEIRKGLLDPNGLSPWLTPCFVSRRTCRMKLRKKCSDATDIV